VKEKCVEFFVPGIPVPKGSARAFVNRYTGRASVMQTNAERQKPWASLISLKAQEAVPHPVSTGCCIHLDFIMPRPKSHLNTKGEVKQKCVEMEHVKKPDLDKLIRCVLDALTGVIYMDDSQVVLIDAEKGYATEAEIGCKITIYYLHDDVGGDDGKEQTTP
jgi:Holliday junction resolvase RusA-like endonuclease